MKELTADRHTAAPVPVAAFHDFAHCPRCQPFRQRRRFDLFPWLAGAAVTAMLAMTSIRVLVPGAPGWLSTVVSRLYWLSVVAFGPWAMLRWRNTYVRWRTVSAMSFQTLTGVILSGAIANLLHVPPLLRGFHLTWPLHLGVLMPAQWADHTRFLYGALMSLLVWPAVALVLGKRYCSWFCSCGNLAETAGEAFRTRGPKGPQAQRLDVTFYVVLGLAALVTAAAWLGTYRPYHMYWWVVGFVCAEAIGLGLYPILGSRPWCRFFCPLTAGLGALSQRGRFAIYTDGQRCVECGTCNRYCEMGIDIRRRAREGVPLKDDQCVACGACIAVCPRYALSFRPFPGPEAALAMRNGRRFRKRYTRELATPRERTGA